MSAREDRQDIAEVIMIYATAIDRREWSRFSDMFTADADIDYGEIGKWSGADEIGDFMRRAHETAHHTMHRLTNQVITVDGDTAKARTYVDALIIVADDGSGVNAVGFYDDHLVRRESGWLVDKRVFTPVRLSTLTT
jgi:hypothetical protein